MIPNELIERALTLTGKTMDNMMEYHMSGSEFWWYHFCYYLCSREFLSKYYIWPYKYPDRNELKELIGEFGYAIMDYQNGMEEPLISLLEQI